MAANSVENGTEPQSGGSPVDTAPAAGENKASEKKWPGWPGDSVFRLIVPVSKVGGIIGRKGDLIKRMCEETRARIRILEGALGTTDRIVLISGKEDPDATLPPAMDAVMRVFKRVIAQSEGEDEGPGAKCAIRMLVASSQAIYLIGKQGSVIKSIQESSGASVRVLPESDIPFYASPDERIIDIQGETSKVQNALEAVIGQLRKFLVDRSVLPLYEKTYNAPQNANATQERPVEPWVEKTHPITQSGLSTDFSFPSLRREAHYGERENQLEPQYSHSGLSAYGQDPGVGGHRPSGLGRAVVTQVGETMKIPLSYAEDIIGLGGTNIAYIRRTSGAILSVQESPGMPQEITVEIKGTTSQVQTAHQLIQEFIAGRKEPVGSNYGVLDGGLRSYSHLSSYPSSSLASQPLGSGYAHSGIGGYSSYRL